jgi:hypothetical protein
MVFFSSSSRETAKNAIKQNRREKRQGKKSQFFWQKVFLIWTNPKSFLCVFELPLLRNAQKRHLKKNQNLKKEKRKYSPTPFSGYLPDVRRFQLFFS